MPKVLTRRSADADATVDDADDTAVAVADAPQADPIPDEVRTQTASVAAHRRELIALAQQIIVARIPSIPASAWIGGCRQYFASDELQTFDAIGWTLKELGEEIGRVRKIIQYQQRAGTSADRAAAIERRQQAQERLASRGTEIPERIAALQAELAGLQDDAARCTRDCEQRAAAVQNLRLLVPVEVKDRHEREMAARISVLDNEIGKVRIAIEYADRLAKIEAGSINGNCEIENVARARGLASFFDTDAVGQKTLNRGRWQSYVGEIRGQLPELQARLRELKASREAVKTDVDSILDVFAR